MEINHRTKAVSELKAEGKLLRASLLGSIVVSVLLAVKLAFQSEIIVMQTPGMPNNTVIQKTSMDKTAQMATLYAVTNNLAQVNPSNLEYIKTFLQVYLSPQVYTRISKELNEKVQKLISQRELGSYYFVLRGYDYDPKLDTHFVKGEVHVVNAAKDTKSNYVFEYKTHIENYRLVIDDIKSYEGDAIHNSEWLKKVKK